MTKKNIIEYPSIDSLDNWRGLLSLVVCFAHITQITCTKELHQNNWMSIWGPLAHASVLLFFFISGYVIFYSLERRINSEEKLIKQISSYFIARFNRIYPPLLGSIFIIYLFKFIIKFYLRDLPIEFTFSIKDVASYLLMFKVSLGKINAPLWSLIIEWWFYYLVFFLYFMFRKSIVYKTISILSILIILNFLLNKLNSEISIYFLIWLLGGVFQRYNLFSRKLLFIILSSCSIIYIIFYKNFYLSNFPIHKSPVDQLLILSSLIGFLFIFKKNQLLSFTSTFSYSIYIIHYPILIFLKLLILKNGIDNWLNIFLLFFLIILISYLFSKTFENKYLIQKIIPKQWL